MNYLVIVPSYIPAYHYGGPIRSVASLNEAMVGEGHSVRVLTTNANGKERLNVKTGTIHEINGVEVVYFNRWTGDHSNFTPGLLWTLWKSAKSYDAIHLHSWWNLVIMPAVFICLLRGVRPVLSPRGSITKYTFNHQKSLIKRWVHRVFGKNLMKQCKLHVTSQQEAEDVNAYLKNPRLYLIPNLLELKPQMVIKNPDLDSLHLVYLGRIDPKKNIAFLLDVVLNDFNIPFTLEFIGDGDPTYVEAMKQKALTNTSITWSGPVYDDRKWLKLATSDILLLPSINENYGNVILEALSQGTAVLISDNVGLKEYVVENKLGWVATLQAAEWRRILRKAWAEKEELAAIRRNASSCIIRDFQRTELVNKYVTMYGEQLSKLD